MQGTELKIIIDKLEAFMRKYYKNKVLRGMLVAFIATLLIFLIAVVLEYFGHFGKPTRIVLFYSMLAFCIYCLVYYMIIPLANMYKLGKTMSYEQASEYIGKYFPDVNDKLLNTLQLGNLNQVQASDLVEAAIKQRVEQFKPIPFTDAVNLDATLKKLPLILIPISIYIFIYVLNPAIIKNGSERLTHYNVHYAVPAPFSFNLTQQVIETPQFSDFEVEVKLKGNTIPDEVSIVIDGARFLMVKDDKTTFTYTIRNVNKNTAFYFEAAGFSSSEYLLKSIAKPSLVYYTLKLQYPAYIGKKSESLENPGDLSIPAGTQLIWEFKTKNTDEIILGFGKEKMLAKPIDDYSFTFKKTMLKSAQVWIQNKNKTFGTADSLAYTLEVIPDAYPQIAVDAKADSISGKQLFFMGDANDDYGLTKLVFAYRFIKSDDANKKQLGVQMKPIAIVKGEKNQRFYYEFNLNDAGIGPADELEYYFEVWDNDGVQGVKSSKSRTFTFKAPSEKEMRNDIDAAGKSLKAEMEQAMRESKKLQKELKDLQLKMTEKRELTWEEKKKAEDILKRQKDLVKQLEELKKQNQQINHKEEEFKAPDPQLLEKQKELEKLFDELLNDEMKKLLKDMEKLLQQQQNKDLLKQEMDKMQLNNKDVEKELDRMLEQFKQLEIDKKLTETTNNLKKLAEEQEKLAEQTKQLEQQKGLNNEQKQQATEQLKQQQQKLDKEFKDLQDQLKEIEKQNSELEEPKELENTNEEQKEISENQEQAKEQLNKKDLKKASQNQQKAAEKMEQMAKKMEEKQEQEEQEQQEEDAAALREILENTIQLSKDQETLIEAMKTIVGYNPQYVDLAKQQKVTRDNAKIIEDSLLALSKRVPQIRSFINREVTKLNDNLDRSVQGFNLRNFADIRIRQQYAMTHANNLAVMLSEVLNQMQQENQQAKQQKSGKGKGKPKPGQGAKSKPLSMSQLKKMQEELNKQLREGLNKKGEEGKPNDGKGQKPGGQQQGGNQPNMSSEGFARMAAQQMAIRQQLQKMMQQMDAKQKEGVGGAKMLEEMKRMMEQTEKELFNKQLTTEMLMRQQEIMTRLLESEKAERKQEQEEKREAEQAKDKNKPSPPAFDLYQRQKQKENELLETIPADMQPYYKDKTKQYFNRLR